MKKRKSRLNRKRFIRGKIKNKGKKEKKMGGFRLPFKENNVKIFSAPLNLISLFFTIGGTGSIRGAGSDDT